MDREAWRATVQRVAKSRTRLKQLSTHPENISPKVEMPAERKMLKKATLLGAQPHTSQDGAGSISPAWALGGTWCVYSLGTAGPAHGGGSDQTLPQRARV